jgi:uncharacterized integral membrane protein
MLLPDDHTSTPKATERATDAMGRLPHSGNRRSVLNERRQSLLHQKHTDSLPRVNGESANGKLAWRQVIQLREENKRLRCELNALQTQFDQELAAVRSGHQQEVEQYQSHLRDLMEERNHMQEAQLQLEQRYQELYHSFQEAVEEEAYKMVTEAANTVVLTPEHTPVLLRDLKKTIELQSRQVKDQHLAQSLYLMREAQRKAQQIEQELDKERQQLATERQNLLTLQNSLREQAKLRFAIQQAHLQVRWTAALATTITLIVLVLIFLQWFAYHTLGLSLLAALLLPALICFLLTVIAARLWASYKHFHHSTPHKASHKHKK